MTDPIKPKQGEVWYAYLGPVRGVEQDGRRPVLIISNDEFNALDNNLVWIIPITSTLKGIGYQVEVGVGEGGLRNRSAIMCEQLRSIDRSRLKKALGIVSGETLSKVTLILSMIPTYRPDAE